MLISFRESWTRPIITASGSSLFLVKKSFWKGILQYNDCRFRSQEGNSGYYLLTKIPEAIIACCEYLLLAAFCVVPAVAAGGDRFCTLCDPAWMHWRHAFAQAHAHTPRHRGKEHRFIVPPSWPNHARRGERKAQVDRYRLTG